MKTKQKTLESQIRYSLDIYNPDLQFNMKHVKRLLQKLIDLYLVSSSGYWEADFDAISSTQVEDSIAMEMNYKDAIGVAGIMSCVPAIILILVKYIQSRDKTEMTEEDLRFLEQIEKLRGTLEPYSMLPFQDLNELLNSPIEFEYDLL